jgi:uncharacterized protein YkwD
MVRPHAVLFVLLCSAAMGCSGSPVAPDDALGDFDSGAPASQIAIDIVRLTNDERAAAGIPELRVSAGLMDAARIHAGQMAAARQMAHTLPDAPHPTLQDRLTSVGYVWQSAGENIAAGYSGAAQAVDGWMHSSRHRANILGTSYTEIGTSHATDTSGASYYVQVFGRPR